MTAIPTIAEMARTLHGGVTAAAFEDEASLASLVNEIDAAGHSQLALWLALRLLAAGIANEAAAKRLTLDAALQRAGASLLDMPEDWHFPI